MGDVIEEHDNLIFYYKGETPGKHGVGFLIKKDLKEHIQEIIGITERIAILNLKFGNENWSIVQVYSPTEQSSTTEIETFYSQLNTAIKEHTHKNLIVMGDYNAQVGEKRKGEELIMGPFCYGKRTRNGEKLIALAYENNLKILNTQYEGRKRNRWTWLSPGGLYRNEIDYILTNKSKLFEDCRVIKNLNFNSNHRMVRANLIANNDNKQRPFKARPFIKREVLPSDELKTQLVNLKEAVKEYDIQGKYDKLCKILTTTTQENIIESKDKMTEVTLKLLERRANLLRTKGKTKTMRTEISKLSKQIKENMRKDRQTRRLKTFETHIRKTGGIKKALRELKHTKEWIPKLKTRSGICTANRTNILTTATNFYRDLFSKRSFIAPVDLKGEGKVPEILVREVEKAIETQKRDKSPGPDNISNEYLMACKELISPIITQIFNDVLTSEYIPSQWLTSTITLLHKKGDKSDVSNYRPISLMSNIYKIFAKVILNRITISLDENQPKEQAGFRSGYSTLDHIHVVKQIIEKSKEYNMPLYCCFVDYSKAFDSLEHESIWQALKNQGIELKYIRIIKNIYLKSTAKIKLEKEGNEIRIERGVRQGDPLSPKLFSAVLEEIFRKMEWKQYGLNINGEKLTHLRFADDLIIISSNEIDLTNMLTELDTESRKVGLIMNASKTKAMTNSTEEPIKINNKLIEYVQEYTYLGQVISPKDLTTKEIETRIGNAWKRYWTFREIMKNKETSLYIKRKLYNTCVLPVLTYGCQTWALTKAQNRKLEVCQRSMERSMLSIRLSERINNAKIRELTKIKNVTWTIRKNKWRWAGHTQRGSDKWSKNITSWYPLNRKRKRGRQFKRWVDDIKAVAGNTWSRTARAREEWKLLEEAFVKLGQTDTVVD